MPLFLAFSVALAEEVRRDNTGEPLLAVSVQSERNAGLYVLNADGTVVGQLTTNGGDLLPAWALDGKTLAFLALRDQDHAANERFNLAFHWFLYVVDADGKHLRRVTDTPVGMRFQWSPNGKQFLFQSSYEDVRNRGTDGVLSSAIYVIRADGTQQKRLTPIEDQSAFAVWSPDGRRIAFSSNRDGNHDIYVIGAGGEGLTRLTMDGADDTLPLWSPDGRWIAFASRRVAAPGVYLMQANGSQQRLVFGDGWPVAWSAASEQLLVASDSAVFLVTQDGTRQTRLATGPGRVVDPSFSPNGKSVLYRSPTDDGMGLFSIEVDGKNRQRLAKQIGNVSGFAVFPRR